MASISGHEERIAELEAKVKHLMVSLEAAWSLVEANSKDFTSRVTVALRDAKKRGLS